MGLTQLHPFFFGCRKKPHVNNRSLYIHIPFCVRRCIYCAFYLEPLGTGSISKRLRDHNETDNSRFIGALDTELSLLPSDFAPHTIYIGGGTPTELSPTDFQNLFASIHRHIDTTAVTEWTIEANPGTLIDEKISCMLEGGVNRVSLGIQSFDPATLEFLGRLHEPAEAIDTVHRLRKAGCNNLSLDLIIAIPGRENQTLQKDIQTLIDLKPEHASAYALELDEGAPLRDLADKGLFTEMDDEQAADQYQILCDQFNRAGIQQYEVSNFSRPGYESKHNQHYWDAGEYFGCGPSAAGHIDHARYTNVPNLMSYCTRLEKKESPVHESERLSAEDKARETLMLALRRRSGITREAFLQRSGFDFIDLCEPAIEKHLQQGFMEYQGDALRLTESALFISDGIFQELL